MRAISKLLNFADDLLELAFLGAWRKSKTWPFTSIALLILTCLSLIFVAGPCATTDEVAGKKSLNADVIKQLQKLVDIDIAAVPFNEATHNDLNAIVNDLNSDGSIAGDSKAMDDESEITGLTKFFYKRPFLDKFPRDQHDKYKVYFFTDKSVGAYMEMEYMKQINEFFLFKRVLNRFAYVFPYSKLKGMTRFKLESCEGPGTFDLKMTVINDPKFNKEKRVFYSWKSFKPPVSE